MMVYQYHNYDGCDLDGLQDLDPSLPVRLGRQTDRFGYAERRSPTTKRQRSGGSPWWKMVKSYNRNSKKMMEMMEKSWKMAFFNRKKMY